MKRFHSYNSILSSVLPISFNQLFFKPPQVIDCCIIVRCSFNMSFNAIVAKRVINTIVKDGKSLTV